MMQTEPSLHGSTHSIDSILNLPKTDEVSSPLPKILDEPVSTTIVEEAKIATPPLQRRIIAEDLKWTPATAPRLSSLCLHSIVQHFAIRPTLQIPSKYLETLYQTLPTNLPVSITANIIHSDTYWRRAANDKWPALSASGTTWKTVFFQHYIAELLETIYPEQDEDVPKVMQIASPYVRELDIKQLRPLYLASAKPVGNGTAGGWNVFNYLRKQENTIEKTDSQETLPVMSAPPNQILIPNIQIPGKLPKEGKDRLPEADHVDMRMVLSNLKNIQKLSLKFGIKDVGMSFEWAFFGMTYNDCNRLSEGLRINTILQHLSIRNSEIDDPKMELLCNALSENNTLQYLDVQHNQLSSASTGLFAKLHGLRYLDVSSNKLQSLQCPPNLETLLVQMNPLGDAGFIQLLGTLPSDKLTTLRIDACGLSRESMIPLFSYLSAGNCVLKRLGIGNNRDIGEFGGKMIFEHLTSPSGSGKLVQCEVRGCEIESETEEAILGAVRQVARRVAKS